MSGQLSPREWPLRESSQPESSQPESTQPELNPYAPPKAATWDEWPLLPPERWGVVQVRVDRVVPGHMDRRIWIGGTTLAEIHYYQAAMDTVEVNGQVRGRGSMWDTSIVSPTIEFWLDGEGYRIPARVDAAAGFSWLTVFRLTHFRLTVAGKVVYEEGQAPVAER